MTDIPIFKLESSRVGESLVVAVFGEVDSSTADQLATEVLAVTDGSARVIVDLSGVTFLDSSGLNALIRAQRALAAREIGMRCVVPENGIVRRVIEITRLTEHLAVVGSLQDAQI